MPARRRTVPPDPPGGDRVIELRDISFAYDDAVVLRDVDVTIDESELVLVS